MRFLKTILLVGVLFFLFGFTYSEKPEKNEEQENTVYICNSLNSYRYHSHSGCGGLQTCTHGIYEVSIEKAISMGRTPCKRCY